MGSQSATAWNLVDVKGSVHRGLSSKLEQTTIARAVVEKQWNVERFLRNNTVKQCVHRV